MKHSTKRLLAVLLVLAMGIGMVPFAALPVGAEEATVPTLELNEDGSIKDLGWNAGYVGSPTNEFGNQWKISSNAWSSSYRYSDVVTIPYAGTTLVWSESTVTGSMSTNAMLLSSWKLNDADEWVIDFAGTNLGAVPNAGNENQIYNQSDNTMLYTYTTTRDNESLRFSCYGGKADGNLTANAAECPKVYVYTPTFTEGTTEGEGTVEGLLWRAGFVSSYTNDYYAVNTLVDQGAAGTDYNVSAPILVPKAGTTIAYTESAAKRSSEQAYVFSTWTVGGDGKLDLFYGWQGFATGQAADCAWGVVNEDGTYTYFYTTSYDNEFLRITYRGDASAAVISYKENNAENCAPVLQAAGYSAAQAGTPYLCNWYNGLISPEDGILVGSPLYYFSDIIPVYGKGTTVTFVDQVYDAEAGVGNFLGDSLYAIAKFNGEGFTGVAENAALIEMVEGVMTGDSVAAREEALAAGKRVYTYTTTEDIEYLRLSFSGVGNAVNGYVVAPLVYITAPNNGTYYNDMEGLKLVAIGDSYFFGGGANNDDTWVNQLAKRYNMEYRNYGKDGSTVSNYVTTNNNPMVDRYAAMADGADIVIFEGGRNDYNKSVPLGTVGDTNPATFLGAVQTILAGLKEKYPNALIVCVTPWNLEDLDTLSGLSSNNPNEQGLCTEDYALAFASYVESLNDDRVIAIRSFDDDVIPVFMTNAAFRKQFCVSANDISHLNKQGHSLVMPWFEKILGPAYQNFEGLISTDAIGVRFMHGNKVLATYGTAAGNRDIVTPNAPDGVAVDNFFGWVGTVNNGGVEELRVLPASETVEIAKNDSAVFEALYLDLEQVAEPTLRFGDAMGLRFLAKVSENDYKSVLTKIGEGALGDAGITLGMLIVPYAYVVDMGGELTHAALDAADKQRVDVVSTIAENADGSLDWYDYDAATATGMLAGTVSDILAENHTVKYTARGYAKLTINGVDYYSYAEFGGLSATTVYDLAIEALNDCSEDKDATYTNDIGNGLFAPYTVEQREALTAYVGNVISLETVTDADLNCTTAKLVEYTYYNPNANYMTMTLVGGYGDDSLSDIFYPFPAGGASTAVVNADGWDELIDLLEDDNITSILALAAQDGSAVSADGGILLDGMACDTDDSESVRFAVYEIEGYTFYLFGFCDYAPYY